MSRVGRARFSMASDAAPDLNLIEYLAVIGFDAAAGLEVGA